MPFFLSFFPTRTLLLKKQKRKSECVWVRERLVDRGNSVFHSFPFKCLSIVYYFIHCLFTFLLLLSCPYLPVLPAFVCFPSIIFQCWFIQFPSSIVIFLLYIFFCSSADTISSFWFEVFVFRFRLYCVVFPFFSFVHFVCVRCSCHRFYKQNCCSETTRNR